MKILPAELKPPKEPTRHRHQPNPTNNYRLFLPCLRCEFGFTCAFCLLHEMDFSLKIGAAGTGQMSVEHLWPQSTHPSKKNQYSNCIYACTCCNRSRSTSPVIDRHGNRLLNPSHDTWSDHFIWDDCKIRPREGDIHAAYTHETYDIDEPKKVARRKFRKELYSDRLPLFVDAAGKIERLLAKANRYRDEDRDLCHILMETIREFRRRMKKASSELSWYPAVPPDAPSHCRCNNPQFSLPPGLAVQMIDLPRMPG